MTLKEKASLCSGSDFWLLQPISRLGLERVMVSDGPNGLRKQASSSDHLGIGTPVKATCFPAGVNIASSWDTELCKEVAACLARECRAEGVSVILGPPVNIKRNPLCGRSFEYYSEDPHLAGELGVAFVLGVQGEGVGASVKHFVANNQEFHRMRVDTLVDERTLRELYLPAFERVVVGSQPWTVMTACMRAPARQQAAAAARVALFPVATTCRGCCAVPHSLMRVLWPTREGPALTASLTVTRPSRSSCHAPAALW